MTDSQKSQISPEPINDIGSINLKNHLVIEASAGTGKTYTLENIVVSLLEQGLVESQALRDIRKQVDEQIQAAVEFAEASEFPKAEAALEDIFV